MRRRVRREYTWTGSGWLLTNEVRYVYEGRLVLQERSGNNLPLVTYTRGNDLSGTLQGAGGIGGLLARTENPKLLTQNSQTAHAYYHSDGNGNVTCMVNTNGAIVARYHYDPYGNTLTTVGPMAEVNLYRFSSKEWHPNSGLVYYLYRYYEPSFQRWVNMDPIGELGGINLYMSFGNTPVIQLDRFGLRGNAPPVAIVCSPSGGMANAFYSDYVDSTGAPLPSDVRVPCIENCLKSSGAPVAYWILLGTTGTIGAVPKPPEAPGPSPVTTPAGYLSLAKSACGIRKGTAALHGFGEKALLRVGLPLQFGAVLFLSSEYIMCRHLCTQDPEAF